MTSLSLFFDTPLTEALGWTLLHSLWQGSLIAILITICWRVLGDRAAQQRYWIGLIGMGGLCIWSGLTFVQAYTDATAAPLMNTIAAQFTQAEVEIHTIAPIHLATASPAALWDTIQQSLHAYTPWIALAWGLGYVFFLLRWVGAWAYTQRLRYRDAHPMSGLWQSQLNGLAQQMGISKTLLLIESQRIAGPMTVGFFKPVVLVPVGLLSGMNPAQVEAILVHELAHIRRHDYLINLLVSLVEAVFFYHPAVWFIGNRIREAREHCCDDLAIATSGDPMTYARTLTALATGTAPTMAPGLVGPRKQLLFRVKRLFGAQPSPRPASGATLGLLALAFLFVAGWVAPNTLEAAAALEDAQPLMGGTGDEIPWFYPVEGEAPLAPAEVWAAEPAVSSSRLVYAIVPIDSPPPSIPPPPPIPAPPTPHIPDVPPPPPFPPLPDSLSEAEKEARLEGYEQQMEAWGEAWSTAFAQDWENHAQAWEAWGEAFGQEMEEKYAQWGDSLALYMEANQSRLIEIAEEAREREYHLQEEAHSKQEVEREVQREMEEVAREMAEIQREVQRMEQEDPEAAHERAEQLREKAEKLRELAMIEKERALEIRMEELEALREMRELDQDRIRAVLLADGFIKDVDDKVVIKSKNGDLRINGKKVSGTQRQKYGEMFREMGIELKQGSEVSIRF